MSLPKGTCTYGRRFRRAFSTKSSVFVPWVPEAFHARFPVSVIKSDPREKPLDQSATPLIVPSQLQPRLYQNILRRSRLRPSAELVSAALSSPSHARKNLWYPGYGFWGEIVTYQELICMVTLLTSLPNHNDDRIEKKKSNMLNKQNNNSERTCRTLFSRFLCLHHTRLTLSNLTGKAIRSSL